jgi:hypothetical protein
MEEGAMKTVLTVEIVDGNVKVRGTQLPQTQASLTQQLKDLIPLANKIGCYDAADYLRQMADTEKI